MEFKYRHLNTVVTIFSELFNFFRKHFRSTENEKRKLI